MVVEEAMKLVGFVGDYRGTKNSLTYFRPVVNFANANWVAMTQCWTKEDLRRLEPADYRYVQPLNEVDVRPGDGVWVAGQLLVNRCVDIEGFGNRLKVWRSFRGEYRFSAGSYAHFLELNQQIYAAAVRLLHRALFDPADLGRASRIFEVVNNLHYVDSHDQQIQRGLYYHEVREMHRYAMVSADAVVDGLVANQEDFDGAVQDLVKRLSGVRLRDLEQARTDGPQAALDLRQLTERSRATLLLELAHTLGLRRDDSQPVDVDDLTTLLRGGRR